MSLPSNESTDQAVPSGTRKRLDHVDAMRPIKQAAVISTHAIIFFAPLSTSLAAGALLTLTHFSRDAFLFVSACMLAYSYRERDRVALGTYIPRRFFAVGVPYLVWSVIYFPLSLATPVQGFPYYHVPWSTLFTWSGLTQLAHEVATGYYHLYFLVVLIEFYVLFPALLWVLRRLSRYHAHIVVVSVVWQILWHYSVRHWPFLFHLSAKAETRLVFSYPLYLIGGVVAAFHLQDFHDWVVRHARSILVWTFLWALVPVGLDALNRYVALSAGWQMYLVPGGDPFSPLVIPYDVGAIVAVYLFGVYLVAPGRSARTRLMTQSGSDNSYAIYLSQMVWILFMARFAAVHHLSSHVAWPIMMFFAVTIAYFTGWFLGGILGRTPVAKAVVGRSRVPWNTLIPHVRTYVRGYHDDYGPGPMDLSVE